jgi:hypothetical protein
MEGIFRKEGNRHMKKGALRFFSVLLTAGMLVSGGSAPAKAETASGSQIAMYRVYNGNSGEHFYTSSTSERDSLIRLGWSDEGIGWYAPSTGSPVYRLYNANGGEHHYTLSASERDRLVAVGWKYEGIGWYSASSNTVPVYRSYNVNAFNCNHNFTTSVDEKNQLTAAGWRDEGIAWYAAAKGVPKTVSDTTKNSSSASSKTATISNGASIPQIVSYMQQSYGITREQACGIAGNLYRESGCNPCVIEGGYKKGGKDASIGFDNNPSGYAAAVKNGTYRNFTTDQVGFGLGQFTSSFTKTKLLQKAQQYGTRVDDLKTQLDLLGDFINDTRNYPYLKARLTTAGSAEDAAYVWLTCFEMPGWANITSSSSSYAFAQREGAKRKSYARMIANMG